MKTIHPWLALAALGFFITPAHAQSALGAPPTAAPDAASPEGVDASDDRSGAKPNGFFSIGPGAVPKFDGAKQYQPIPLVIANIGYRGVDLEVRGLGARLDLLGNSRVQFGPVFNFRQKRDSADDGSGRVKLLDDVDASYEVGGYIGYRTGGSRSGQGEIGIDLTVTKDIGGGHEGVIGTAQLSYAAYRSPKFFLNLDTQTSFASRKYMRAFFGVTPAEALRAGLAAYRPDGGIRDAGAGLTAGYQINRRWGLIARAGANYYLGDANDSPVADEGSKVQAIGGLALSYRF